MEKVAVLSPEERSQLSARERAVEIAEGKGAEIAAGIADEASGMRRRKELARLFGAGGACCSKKTHEVAISESTAL